MRKHYFTCLLLLLSGTNPVIQAHATPDLSQLTAHLHAARVIHADFVQTKSLLALKQPLRTSGQMVLTREWGLLWHIGQPYQASYVLEKETVTEIASNGARTVHATRDVPALAHIGNVFQALFQGDMHNLEPYFEVTVAGNVEHWRIDLQPKPALARFLKSITAQGGRFLEQIDVDEMQGDHTHIVFYNTLLDAPLSDTHMRLLKGN